ncbi:cyclase family protein [Actinomadura parmotrematis]|uniref:Cyclase family protein n=1 Tax=Actinomadura parmotrematis TaxID=2864039 RepID=A0ABS7FTK4_9ACTN|nr:cyclase family protein [Actinomadura parmotrematis]MBW8483738.1 cyclase family protein [Actinomadura parmotrematis]
MEPVERELVDLSVPLESGMPVYPGDPEVEIGAALTAASDGVNVQRLHLGSQSGTHVDAPFHIDGALPPLEDLPLERFTGPAVLLDARGLAPRAEIGPELLPAGLRPGTVLLIATGWSRHWGSAEYLAHPYPAPETAEAIVAAGVRTVGIDALSVDRTPPPGDGGFSLAVHRVLCGAHAVIAENLTGLDRLLDARDAGSRIEVSLFPIRLSGDGAPVRAVAAVTSSR